MAQELTKKLKLFLFFGTFYIKNCLMDEQMDERPQMSKKKHMVHNAFLRVTPVLIITDEEHLALVKHFNLTPEQTENWRDISDSLSESFEKVLNVMVKHITKKETEYERLTHAELDIIQPKQNSHQRKCDNCQYGTIGLLYYCRKNSKRYCYACHCNCCWCRSETSKWEKEFTNE